jgi:hypothetical protein
VSAVLGELWCLDILPENVCQKVQIPKNATVEKRERPVLADDELLVYIGWQHPDETHRRAVLERQTMACISRIFGGIRWGDIRALTWEAFETTEGRFSYGWAPPEEVRATAAVDRAVHAPSHLARLVGAPRAAHRRAHLPGHEGQASRRGAEARERRERPSVRPWARVRHRGAYDGRACANERAPRLGAHMGEGPRDDAA